MAVLQGTDNEFVMNFPTMSRLKRCLETGKNVPDEQESPIRKRVVRLRETTSLLPRKSK